MVEISDYELIGECLNGNQNAFALLVTRYKKFIYSIVYKYFKNTEDVYDISQEVFLKVYKSLDKYNPQFKFSTWCGKIAVNMCLDMLRKKSVDFVPLEEIDVMAREYTTPEVVYLEKEQSLQISSAIEKLPEKYKSIFVLYQKGISYKEMGEALNEPMSIIKNRLYRAKLMLKENLAGHGSLYNNGSY